MLKSIIGDIMVVEFKILYRIGLVHRRADKSLARPRRKQGLKYVRNAPDCYNFEMRAFNKVFLFLQGKTPKEIHAILKET
jgi:hypothetical protein